MTDIEIHGVMKCIETMPIKKLQQLETYTENNLRNIRKELDHRKTRSISELALATHGL